MQSVSPVTSTISSQSWQQVFEVEFDKSVDPQQKYRMRFAIVGKEWEPSLDSWQIVGRKVSFYVSYNKLVRLGFKPSIGQIISPLALEVTIGDPKDKHYVEIWHS